MFTGNQIKLITDGNYGIDTYEFTYLRKAKDLGSNLSKEYTELPEHTHQEIINMAVEDYVSFASKNISAITNQVN